MNIFVCHLIATKNCLQKRKETVDKDDRGTHRHKTETLRNKNWRREKTSE